MTELTDSNWYESREELTDLFHWMEDEGVMPSDPVYYLLEKPWKLAMEYDAMRMLREKKEPVSHDRESVIEWLRENGFETPAIEA